MGCGTRRSPSAWCCPERRSTTTYQRSCASSTFAPEVKQPPRQPGSGSSVHRNQALKIAVHDAVPNGEACRPRRGAPDPDDRAISGPRMRSSRPPDRPGTGSVQAEVDAGRSGVAASRSSRLTASHPVRIGARRRLPWGWAGSSPALHLVAEPVPDSSLSRLARLDQRLCAGPADVEPQEVKAFERTTGPLRLEPGRHRRPLSGHRYSRQRPAPVAEVRNRRSPGSEQRGRRSAEGGCASLWMRGRVGGRG
jgi:hypothetical protein